MRLILASGSQSRRAMLEAAGVAFEIIPAAIDERALERNAEGQSPSSLTLHLAMAKALAVATGQPGDLVLGGDSLVNVEGRRFDKPRSRAEAAEHLRHFSDKHMELHSAAALARGDEIVWRAVERAILAVRPLSEGFIETYLDSEWPEVGQCVGAFRIEGRGAQLFDHIDGDMFTVLGMPLLQVLGALRELGVLQS